jgi:hypothetical protein
VPISKVLSVFCFLEIESYNLKHEIESRFFDPLILFGESGLVFEEMGGEGNDGVGTGPGDMELQVSRSMRVYN